MKTKNCILLILMTAFTLNVFATKMPQMNITVLDNAKALVEVEVPNSEKTVISFESEDGNIIYYKELLSYNSNFEATLNLTDLKNGTYKVKVKTGYAVIKSSIILKDGKISVEPVKTEYDPVFVFNDNTLRISYLNLGQNDFEFRVYKDGGLIYNRKMGNAIDMQTKFNFSWLNKGAYEVILASEDEKYCYTVKK